MSKKTKEGTAYDDLGPKEGPVLVLIHGLGLCRGLWDDHLQGFEGYRIIAYDLFGHGDSSPPPMEASLTVFSDQLANLLDELGVDKAHIIGFSIGGMINRRFALDYPDKLSSLVILNSPHNRGSEAQERVESRARSVREQGAFSTFDAALKRWFTPDYLLTGSGPHLVRKWREKVDAESYAQTAWVLAHGVRELISPDPAIVAPSFIMTCENDTGSTPSMAEDIAAEIPNAKLQIIPKLQHLGLMETPSSFTKPILKFLQGVENDN